MMLKRIVIAVTVLAAVLSAGIYGYIKLSQKHKIDSVNNYINASLTKYTKDYKVEGIENKGGYYLAVVDIDDVDLPAVWFNFGTAYDTFGLIMRAPRKNLMIKFNIRRTTKVCLILDDFGYKMGGNYKMFLKLKKLNITASILPKLRYSSKIDRQLRAAGFFTELHLPLQPLRWPYVNPGKGTIFVADDTATILRKFKEDINSVGPVSAVNNHEGSGFTEYRAGMRVLLKEIYGRGLFFIDSRTTAKTVVPEVAEKLGYTILARKVFIDGPRHFKRAYERLKKLFAIAKKNGYAIGIGHITNKYTLQTLLKLNENIQKYDVSFVTPSTLYKLKKIGIIE